MHACRFGDGIAMHRLPSCFQPTAHRSDPVQVRASLFVSHSQLHAYLLLTEVEHTLQMPSCAITVLANVCLPAAASCHVIVVPAVQCAANLCLLRLCLCMHAPLPDVTDHA